MDLTTALIFDAVLLSLCTVLLVRFGRLSALHPAPTYLFFHAYVVTFRLLQLYFGARLMTLLADPPSMEEVLRAAWAFDLVLITMTVTWLYLARRTSLDRNRDSGPAAGRGLVPKQVRFIAYVVAAIGVAALVLLRSLPWQQQIGRQGLGDWGASFWVAMTLSWALQGCLMAQYVDGFSVIRTSITAVVVAFTAMGFHRYAVILFGLFWVLSYLSRKNSPWPSPRMLATVLCLAILWLPLKVVRSSYWAGDDIEATIQKASSNWSDMIFAGDNADVLFLDAAAVWMTQVDRSGEFSHGELFLPLLVSPIPRPLWPDKPPQNAYQRLISSDSRPLATLGMVGTMVGEGYANWGYAGVILTAWLIAFGYGKAYFRAIRRRHSTVERYAYLVFLCVLLEVLRDGLSSAFVFTVINAMPMMFVIYVHWLFPKSRRSSRRKSIYGGRRLPAPVWEPLTPETDV